MANISFPTDHASIINRILAINPSKYAATRNFEDGAVSYLSPYISRGVISLPQIREIVLEKHDEKDCWKFFQELSWREYFQRVYQAKGEAIFEDLKTVQPTGKHNQLSVNLLEGTTGVDSIDEAINTLYEQGYMHNHWRMYTASICCNMAFTKWLEGAKWMYYNLLDADLASNHLSWQWVSGSFSKGPYVFNQENLNKYSRQEQRNTFLDKPYSEFPFSKIPEVLKQTTKLELTTDLPKTELPNINQAKPVLIYTPYNLDPNWRKEEDANRILLLSPKHFERFPMGENTLNFILELSKNIEGIQVYCGELEDLQPSDESNIFYKEHPAFKYPGTQDERDWLHPGVKGYYPSFSAYMKKVNK